MHEQSPHSFPDDLDSDETDAEIMILPADSVAIVQAGMIDPLPAAPGLARTSAQSTSRLGGRALRIVGGRSVLAQLIERVQQVASVGQIVVALSVAPEDDALTAVARAAGAQVFRGSVHDLVGRMVACAEWLGLPDDHLVVRVMSDSPLVDPGYLEAGLSALRETGAAALEFQEDQAEELCLGLSAGFLRVGTLKLLDRRARTPTQRADVMTYVYEHALEVGLLRVPLPESLAGLRGNHRLLLQTAEDLALIEAVYLRLYAGAPIDTTEAIRYLDTEPVLASLNRGVLHHASTLPMLNLGGWRAR